MLKLSRISWSISLVLLCGFGLIGCGEKAGVKTGGDAAALTTLEGVEGCEGAVLPDLKTIETGTYTPLSRPLFIYVSTKALQKPEVAGFVKTVLNEAQDRVEKASFIKLNSEVLKAQQEKLNKAIADVVIPEKMESGTVVIDGSSTVFPFSVTAAELFQKMHDNKVHVNIGKKGTGGGLEKFCVGETDICNASRMMKPAEAEKAKANGIEYIDFTVCIDGITVCVNPKNDWCHCLSAEQLKALWEPNSKIEKWSDLNPKWPDSKIKLYGPDSDSGTFDFFTEVVVGKARSSRSDYTASAEDNVLVKGISGDKNALGYFGFSYYDKNRKTLKALGVKPAAKKTDGKKTDEKKTSVEPQAKKAAEEKK